MMNKIVPIIVAIVVFFVIFAIFSFIVAPLQMSPIIKGLIKLAIPFVIANITYNVLAKRSKN